MTYHRAHKVTDSLASHTSTTRARSTVLVRGWYQYTGNRPCLRRLLEDEHSPVVQ